MQVELDIDQILQHVLPWDFVVTAGGKKYSTRRPAIGELAALLQVAGKSLPDIEALVNALFADKPDIRWEMPTLLAFLEGYTEYFFLHSKKKTEGDDPTAIRRAAKAMVESRWKRGHSSSD